MKLTDSQSNHVQVLRGLAIIAVVAIHNTPSGLAQVYVRPFLNFCVGLFLFLSGMLSNAEHWNPIKRLTKVVIPYILWSTIFVVQSNYRSLSSIPVELVKALIAGNSASIMYYIFVYCQFTLLIPLIHKLATSKYKYWGFVITPIEILLLRVVPMVAGFEMHKYISMVIGLSCLSWFTFFYLGYLMGNGMLTVKYKTSTLSLWLVISIALQMLEGYWYLSMGTGNGGTQSKLSSVFFGVIVCMIGYRFIFAKKAYSCKPLALLGNLSFGIYFSHLFIMGLLKNISVYTKIAIFPINIVLVLGITTAFVWIGKKLFGKLGKYLAF